MIAHLMLLIATAGGMMGVKIPFPDMAACESFLKDPTPLIVAGPVQPAGMYCVDEPTMPADAAPKKSKDTQL